MRNDKDSLEEKRIVSIFIDEYSGEERIIYKNRRQKLVIRRNQDTPILSMTAAAAALVGQNIRQYRIRNKMTMKDFGERCGFINPSLKQYIQQIEKPEQYGRGGIRFGTLYAAAFALGIDVIDLLPTKEEVAEKAGVTYKKLIVKHPVVRMK